jgi:hypothetical protein
MKNMPAKIKYFDTHQVAKIYGVLFVLLILMVTLTAYMIWMHNKIIGCNVSIQLSNTEKYLNILVIGFGLLMGFSLILIYSIFNAYVGDHKTKLKKLIDKFKCKFDNRVDQTTKKLDLKTGDLDSAIWEQFDMFNIVNPHIDDLKKMSSVTVFLNKRDNNVEIEQSIKSALKDYYSSLSASEKGKPYALRLKELIKGW